MLTHLSAIRKIPRREVNTFDETRNPTRTRSPHKSSKTSTRHAKGLAATKSYPRHKTKRIAKRITIRLQNKSTYSPNKHPASETLKTTLRQVNDRQELKDILRCGRGQDSKERDRDSQNPVKSDGHLTMRKRTRPKRTR